MILLWLIKKYFPRCKSVIVCGFVMFVIFHQLIKVMCTSMLMQSMSTRLVTLALCVTSFAHQSMHWSFMNLDITRTNINKIVLFMSTFLRKHFLFLSAIDEIQAEVLSKMYRDTNSSWHCSICSYAAKLKGDVRKHVESKHVQTNGYTCNVCGKFCPTSNALQTHRSRHHPY